MVTLYEHQELGKRFLLRQKKACLFFEVGTGKTYTALSALTSLPRGLRVLIVAPLKVLKYVWQTQTEYDLSGWDVTYINYDKISRDKSIAKRVYDVIILDEVHRIKGRTTNCSKVMRVLTKKADYVWGLTGTPVANNYADVYNIYHNMNIIEFNESFYEFCNKYYYVRPLERGIYTIPILIAPRTFKVEELLHRIGKHSLVKRAEECIDLPDKTTKVWCEPWNKIKKYKEIEDGIFNIGEEARTMIKLEAINKAHQAANGFVYQDGKVIDLLEGKKNKKLEFFSDRVEHYVEEGEKVIVVYLYQKDKDDLTTALAEFNVTTDVTEFSNDKNVLLLQFSQAEGLNLQFCSRTLFYTYDYSFLKYDQMCGRTYRNGQKNNVTYEIFVEKGTIEELVWQAILRKDTTDAFLKEVLSKNG